jgi:hypothetical protein
MTTASSNLRGMTAPKLLTLQDIAKETRLAYRTVRNYHQMAERRRRDEESRPGDFPAPDDRIGRVPLWKASTVKRWIANRPGRGAFGGRPPKAVEVGLSDGAA